MRWALLLLCVASLARADSLSCPTTQYVLGSMSVDGPMPWADATVSRCVGGANATAPCSTGIDCASGICKGAVCDGLTDDSQAIQAAIDSLPNGGIVQLPLGTCAMVSTLTLTTSSLRLRGMGSYGNSDADGIFGVSPNGTTLKWTGSPGRAMILLTPTGGGAALHRPSIVDLSMECNNVAGTGLQIYSAKEGYFRDVYIRNCTTAGISLLPFGNAECIAINNPWTCCTAAATGTCGLLDARDPQFNRFDGVEIRNYTSGGVGLVLDGDDGSLQSQPGTPGSTNGANTSMNDWRDLQVFHKNGGGIVVKDADTNTFYHTRIYRAGTGTGIGLEFVGNTNVFLTSRLNLFIQLVSSTVVARNYSGKVSGQVWANKIHPLDNTNGQPPPTVEPLAALLYSNATTGTLTLCNAGSCAAASAW